MTTSRAKITNVQIGNVSIEGIMLPDGTFAIAFPQVYELFNLKQKHANREILWLLATQSKGLTVPQTKDKISVKDLRAMALTVPQTFKTEVNDRGLNILTLDEFNDIVSELVISGNKEAIAFTRLTRRLILEQLWSDAFGIRFEKEERQAWMKERQAGKTDRRSITDATQYLINKGERLNYGDITLEVYDGAGVLNAYRAYKKVYKDAKFRNTLSKEELKKVAKMEELTADYVMVDEMDIYGAMEKAKKYIR